MYRFIYIQESAMKVDLDRPIPAPIKGGGRPAIYPFDDMPVGGSFFVPQCGDGENARLAAAARKRRHPGWDYTSRQEKGGVRIWRTA